MELFRVVVTLIVLSFGIGDPVVGLLNLDVPILPSLPLPLSLNTCPALSKNIDCNSLTTSTVVPTCSMNVDNLASGRPQAGSITPTEGEFPPWFNVTLARQGQKLFANNKLNILLGIGYGLMGILSVPDTRQVHLFTDNTGSASRALKRYIATATQVFVWLEDLFSTDPANNAFYTSIQNVKNIHRSVAKNVSNVSPNTNDLNLTRYDSVETDDVMWAAFQQDLEASNIPLANRQLPSIYTNFSSNPQPVSQFSLSLSIFGFIGYPILAPQAFGMDGPDVCEEDWRAWVHLWAIIAHGLGISDEFNICLQPNWSATKSYFQEVNRKFYTPFLFNLNHGSKVMVEAFWEALSGFVPLPVLKTRPSLPRFLKDIYNVSTPRLNAILTLDQVLLNQGYYAGFLPSMKQPAMKVTAGAIVDLAIQGGIEALFGPNLYLTNMDKAEHVFYTD